MENMAKMKAEKLNFDQLFIKVIFSILKRPMYAYHDADIRGISMKVL